MDIESRIKEANLRLNASTFRCTILKKSNRLYLQATLPLRPGSTKLKPYQQIIALGVSANPEGLKLAEKEARKVGALLDCEEFSWQPYLKLKEPELPPVVKEWVEQFEANYFIRRQRNPKSETTWRTDYRALRHCWAIRSLVQLGASSPTLLTQLTLCLYKSAYQSSWNDDYSTSILCSSSALFRNKAVRLTGISTINSVPFPGLEIQLI